MEFSNDLEKLQGGVLNVLRNLIILLVVLTPLALWKIFDIVFWIIYWGD